MGGFILILKAYTWKLMQKNISKRHPGNQQEQKLETLSPNITLSSRNLSNSRVF